jgi:hypothetical protein
VPQRRPRRSTHLAGTYSWLATAAPTSERWNRYCSSHRLFCATRLSELPPAWCIPPVVRSGISRTNRTKRVAWSGHPLTFIAVENLVTFQSLGPTPYRTNRASVATWHRPDYDKQNGTAYGTWVSGIIQKAPMQARVQNNVADFGGAKLGRGPYVGSPDSERLGLPAILSCDASGEHVEAVERRRALCRCHSRARMRAAFAP